MKLFAEFLAKMQQTEEADSSLLDQTIRMPMDSAAYEKKLNQLIAESKLEKKVVEVSNEDFTKSFNR